MKPSFDIDIMTSDEKKKKVNALFDSGSFYSIIRYDCVPSPGRIDVFPKPRLFGTAAKDKTVAMMGSIHIIIRINNKEIEDDAFVSTQLNRDLIVGAKTMQGWDITIRNKRGKTSILVGLDRKDPEITEVD